ncbi:MAG: hypothetical protein JNL65_09065 [Saprospiraceae bacterium]|nr:hypothetical protein [Saprospiraceae bacterium]
MSRIHLIAIGGSVMHNLALALHEMGHQISGSDDQIYEPAKTRLSQAGILPSEIGWDENRIQADIELVILGMHAKSDNPELIKSMQMGIPIQSFPEFVGGLFKNKKQLVVSGSHGKTTTTSMLMHVFKELEIPFDYLVGAQLDGFQNMVSISDAPFAIIEGDEYLSSCLDRRSKFDHFDPFIQIITGIAWDHFNVFPSLESYLSTFRNRIKSLGQHTHLIYCKTDPALKNMVLESGCIAAIHPYQMGEFRQKDLQIYIPIDDSWIPLQIFGNHNLENIQAVLECCKILKFDMGLVGKALQSFKGASKRMELLSKSENQLRYRDFAHAPSKVKATAQAIRAHFKTQKILAVVELHTYSSLSKDFLPQYQNALNGIDQSIIYYDQKALEIKNKEALDPDYIKQCFANEALIICTSQTDLEETINSMESQFGILVFMGSGNFGGIELFK